ncbi:Phosphatidylinositol-specific phospholipase [Metarhizium album ARSEF 1941]|uniref:Phosphatidylinositol-specific phospholipase n=1 Tax=Metarhizium album (strain ARSEF 1941) TaxID=1081103 RepID=A0A0B2WXI6_METAS|nr:Phosphatidylinositol-specific phospholipase [Metarhizium album ARSEF 1941]KHN97585.1 Phosphatidylinositol-specific phospholipase [Metarhizium album ARSEF 1941]
MLPINFCVLDLGTMLTEYANPDLWAHPLSHTTRHPVLLSNVPVGPNSLHFSGFSFTSTALLTMISVRLLPILALTCTTCASTYHGYTSEYSFDANLSHQPDWMARVSDAVKITTLSIPGTHDTMTYSIRSRELQCQNWNLTVQMEAGLRYFDIRARVKENRLHIYHGKEDTGYSFKQVLLQMFEFLDKHPSEMIVMRLKEEGGPVGRNSYSFERAFNYARLHDKATSQGAEKHFALYTDDKSSSKPIPNLGQLRCKIFLLQDFKCAKGKTYGLTWDGPQMVLEDKFAIHGERRLAIKWTAVALALQRANQDPLDDERLYVTHNSAAIGVLPIQAAAGVLDKVQVGMNQRTGKWLDANVNDERSRRTGIVVFDFPGKKPIESVLAWNKHVEAKPHC